MKTTKPKTPPRFVRLRVPPALHSEFRHTGGICHVIPLKRAAKYVTGARVHVAEETAPAGRSDVPGCIVARRDEMHPERVTGLEHCKGPVALVAILSDKRADRLRPSGELATLFPAYVPPTA